MHEYIEKQEILVEKFNNYLSAEIEFTKVLDSAKVQYDDGFENLIFFVDNIGHIFMVFNKKDGSMEVKRFVIRMIENKAGISTIKSKQCSIIG